MKKPLLLFLFYILSLTLHAQSSRGTSCNYAQLIAQGKKYASAKIPNYDSALLKFNSARRCDPSKGEEIDAEIDQVFKRIKAQRDEAERLKGLAQRERANAVAALNKLEIALANVVRSIIRDADRMILNLDYEAAWRKLLTALPLNAAKTELAATLLEPAFWYAETGYYGRARGMLDTITGPGLLNNSSVKTLLRQLPQLDSTAKRLQLRQCIRLLDDAAYVKLQKRYYPVMVRVPGGEFRMGDGGSEIHPVRLSDFEIATTETTVWQWSIFCATTGQDITDFFEKNWSDSGNNPAIHVSWYNAVAYANWLNARYWLSAKLPIDSAITGEGHQLNLKAQGFRLPTEAEWEYAARGGKSVRFGNGKDIADPKEINFNPDERYKDLYSTLGEYRGRTSAVGSLNSPTALGLHDMSGNVWEWCWDWYAAYPSDLTTDYTGPESGSGRVRRGGSWIDGPIYARVAVRSYVTPPDLDFGDFDIGFRLARAAVAF